MTRVPARLRGWAPAAWLLPLAILALTGCGQGDADRLTRLLDQARRDLAPAEITLSWDGVDDTTITGLTLADVARVVRVERITLTAPLWGADRARDLPSLVSVGRVALAGLTTTAGDVHSRVGSIEVQGLAFGAMVAVDAGGYRWASGFTPQALIHGPGRHVQAVTLMELTIGPVPPQAGRPHSRLARLELTARDTLVSGRLLGLEHRDPAGVSLAIADLRLEDLDLATLEALATAGIGAPTALPRRLGLQQLRLAVATTGAVGDPPGPVPVDLALEVAALDLARVGDRAAGSVTLEVPALALTLPPQGMPAWLLPPAATAASGPLHLAGSLLYRGQWDAARGTTGIDPLRLSLDGLGQIALTLRFAGLDPAVFTAAAGAPGLARQATQSMVLDWAELHLRDDGLAARLRGDATATAGLAEAAGWLDRQARSLPVDLAQTGETFRVIAHYLQDPRGRLRLTLTSRSQPVSVIELVRSMLMFSAGNHSLLRQISVRASVSD